MDWKLEWSTEALTELSKLDNKVVARIIEKIQIISKNPNLYIERLAGSEYYKLRVGDYRILILLFHGNQTIFIQRVGHRKNIYKR